MVLRQNFNVTHVFSVDLDLGSCIEVLSRVFATCLLRYEMLNILSNYCSNGFDLQVHFEHKL
jgi:hypothetical protein